MSVDRAAAILARFNAAHQTLVSTLRSVDQDQTGIDPRHEGWNPAQVGCHVAMTNEWIAGVLSGTTPMAQPVPEGFVEQFDVKAVPARLKTSAALEPPSYMGLEAAIERLRSSGHHLSKAIASLSPRRGAEFCVTLPFGTLSLFELADFAIEHARRHIGQVERATAGV